MNRTDRTFERRAALLGLILFVLAGAAVGWANIPQNTLQHGRGLTTPTVNATAGYYVGVNQVVSAARAAQFVTLDTGQGANELYDMDQNVLTTSGVTFATVNTGYGANELYDMDQNMLTISDVSFNTVDATEYSLNTVDVTETISTSQGSTATVGFNAGLDYMPNYWYCDGVADGVQIKAATEYVATLGGGKVYVSSGEYAIASTLIIDDSGVWLDGEGNSTVFNIVAGVNPGILVTGTVGANTEHVKISNLKIYMNYNTNFEVGLYVLYSDYFTTDNVEVTNAKGYGIGVQSDSRHGLIFNCYTHHNRDAGIYLNDGGYVRVDNCESSYNKIGVYIFNLATHAAVTSSRIIENTEGGIYAAIGDVSIIGNDISNNGQYGIKQKTGAGLITGNTLARTGSVDGITIAGGRAIIIENAIGLTVTGNHINHAYYGTSFKGEGIYVTGTSADISISGNTIWDLPVDAGAGVSGIVINAGTDILISGNEIHDVTGYGVQVDAGGTNVDIKINKFVDCDLGGVNNAGTNTIINHNSGFVTENIGTTTILNGTTSIIITHGLAYTPTSGNTAWTVSYLENPTNDPGSWYIDTFTATQTTIHTLRDPGVSHLDISWSARRTP